MLLTFGWFHEAERIGRHTECCPTKCASRTPSFKVVRALKARAAGHQFGERFAVQYLSGPAARQGAQPESGARMLISPPQFLAVAIWVDEVDHWFVLM